MMNIRSHARTLAVVLLCLVAFFPDTGSAAAQSQAPNAAQFGNRTLLRQMVGTWDVQQRMWTGPDSDPVPLPAATAHRRLVHNTYLEENMTLTPDTDGDPFTRHAVLNRNHINQTYEYFSIDSRLPQMMTYPAGIEHHGELSLTLPTPFIAPAWGQDTDVPFTARLQIQPGRDRQIVRLHLRRLSTQPTEEFTAFEYIYTRAG